MTLTIGGQIEIGSNGHPGAQARIAAFRSWQGNVYIVTCAHVFDDGDDEIMLPSTGLVVATLTRNMLNEPIARDIAFARLNEDGIAALGAFSELPTGLPGSVAWSMRDAQPTQSAAVLPDPVHDAPFAPAGPYILTHYRGESPGDSGAPLLSGPSNAPLLCGILRGFAQRGKRWFGYYTPVHGLF